MSDFLLINRCAVIVSPDALFWDWVKKSGEIVEPLLTEVKKESKPLTGFGDLAGRRIYAQLFVRYQQKLGLDFY